MSHVSRYNDSVSADRCYFCPATHSLQTHHVVPQRKNGSNESENLVIVCKKCHNKLERLYDKRFYERLGLTDNKGEERSHFVCSLPGCKSHACVKAHIMTGGGITSGPSQFTDWYCETHAIEQKERHGDHLRVLNTTHEISREVEQEVLAE